MAQIIHDVSFPNDGLGDPLRTAFVNQNEMNTELYDTKVDKVTGQGLSENNYTDTEQTKLSGIEAGAEVNVQSDWLQGDEDADDYIKNKPENFISYPYKAIFPFVDGNVFTMPDGVAVSDVRPNGSGSDIGWTQVGITLTFTSYTLVADDFLVVIGFFNPANVFSPTSGSVQTITSNDLAIGVDDSDPENIVLSFGGVVTDGATINGSGTSLDPLVVIGGGGGGSTWGSITGTLSSQTDLQNALDLKSNINTYNQSVIFDVLFNQLATGLSTNTFNSGTIFTQSDSILSALPLNRPSDIIEAHVIRGSASNANSGGTTGIGSQIPFYVGTTMLIAFNQYTLTSQKSRLGVINANQTIPTTDPGGGIYIEIEDGVLVFKCATSGTITTSATTFTITDPSKWYYAMFEVESSSAIRCKVRDGHNGTLVYNQVITTNLPLSSTGSGWIQLRMSLNAITKTASNNYLLQVGRFLVSPQKPQFLNYF